MRLACNDLKLAWNMKIEHFAMYVLDLEKTRDFFVCYFGAVAQGTYSNARTGFRSCFLSFADGARLEVMTRPGLACAEVGSLRCGYAHVSFSVGSKEAVDGLTERLSTDGYEVVDGPRITGDGYYESCVRGPEGHLVEITV